ncbi:unnamed protein product, partial [Parnassius mnemosyne]
MPLKRTPPPASPPAEKNKNKNVTCTPINICPSLSTEKPSSEGDNVTLRKKGVIDSSSMELFMEEIREIREIIVKYNIVKHQSTLTSVQSSVNEILSQYKDIKESIEMISKQYDSMKVKFDSLEKQRKEDRLYIVELEGRISSLESTIVASKLELRNIPVGPSESKESLCDIVLKTAKALEVPLQQPEIKDVFRIKNKTGNGNIIVDLATTIKKENFLKKARKF